MRRWLNRHQGFTITLTVALVIGAAFARPAISQWAEITVNKILQANTAQPITFETDGDGFKFGTSSDGGSLFTLLKKYAASLSPVIIATNLPTFFATSVWQSFTVSGLTTSDVVLFINGPSPINREPSLACSGILGARVSAANTLDIQFHKNTTATCTPATGTYQFWVLRNP